MSTKILKHVSAPDWAVIYGDNGNKIWEGHGVDTNALQAIAIYFGAAVGFFEFTDEDEIDGCTPDNFNDIKGIK